jgi:hypothetical protein
MFQLNPELEFIVDYEFPLEVIVFCTGVEVEVEELTL